MNHKLVVSFFSALMLMPLWPQAFFTDICLARPFPERRATAQSSKPFTKKINFVFAADRCTPSPSGWEEYDGSIYTKERGYGWLTDLSGKGRDRCLDASIRLANGKDTSPKDLGRPELANWQGKGKENQPVVFRIDLPDGWYRIRCASVDPGTVLPLVDQRCFKCRANDVVLAAPEYGRPLSVPGNQLVEGAGTVEVTDGHLRIIVGDVAYGGWTWTYEGPWYKGWVRWIGLEYHYAHGWHQKLTRNVDPGFHMLRLNALEIEQVAAPLEGAELLFRDYFNRDDSPDLNRGVAREKHWMLIRPDKSAPDPIQVELAHASVKLTGLSPTAPRSLWLLQQMTAPEKGVIRYATRVSLFTGEGSRMHAGAQEAGIVLLASVSGPDALDGTFVTVLLDNGRSETMGWIIYKVGDGLGGYRTNIEIPDTALPMRITEGEYEIIVEHDAAKNLIKKITVNGVDITARFGPEDLRQRRSRGLYGMYSMIHNRNSSVQLKQYYWYYRVEQIQDEDELA